MGLFDFIKNLFKRNKKVSIGLYGHPNSGKTTLANQIAKDWMGKEIGSTSNVPHETRTVLKQEKVIIKDGDNELDFDIIDTPGIATKIDYQNFLEFGLEEGEAKNRAKEATKGIIEAIKWLDDVTGVLLVVDATTDPLTQTNITIIGNLEARNIPFIVVANKIDIEGANPDRIVSVFPQHTVVPISALNGDQTEELYKAMFKKFN
ncbi:GTP-binding protein [Methanobrevibacter sp. TMH8]|uniref:Era-like GTP-binding protein n=1 Tax=Methanobrevibacter sp. TMH8 TaxID=2848611 RepID=UPI001CC9D2DA|nr:Era-like GTP-binding protein [Methanobrevibacter sp. TMH8]MBZ9571624.1 GTP-binding protein [Methanobrevibacter sp. TMH8]